MLYGLSFHFLYVFEGQKSLILTQLNVSVISFMAGAFGVLFKKSFLSFVLKVTRRCWRLGAVLSGHLLWALGHTASAVGRQIPLGPQAWLAKGGRGHFRGPSTMEPKFPRRDFPWTVSPPFL